MIWLTKRLTEVGKPYLLLMGGCLTATAGLSLWLLSNMNNIQSMISGRVQTINGQAVAEAQVYFTSGPAALPDIAALTDTSGRFSLSVPVAGIYQIGCTADGFVSTTVSVNVKTGQDVKIEISLKKEI